MEFNFDEMKRLKDRPLCRKPEDFNDRPETSTLSFPKSKYSVMFTVRKNILACLGYPSRIDYLTDADGNIVIKPGETFKLTRATKSNSVVAGFARVLREPLAGKKFVVHLDWENNFAYFNIKEDEIHE